MKLTDSGGGDFEQSPVGSHIARCVRIIDLGTQKSEYQGKPIVRRQIVLAWELPNELMSGEHEGQPFMISKFYTASLSEKANLRKDLANWRGRDFTKEELSGFESKNVLDKGCMVSVIHNENNKARVSGVMALPKGMILPPRVNSLVYFSLEPGEFDKSVFEPLGEGFKKMIISSPEYHEIVDPVKRNPETNSSRFDDFADDLPF